MAAGLVSSERETVRVRLRVEGIVQGVGFRPYVYALANELALSGWVANDAAGVVVEVEGDPDGIEAFLERLPHEGPPQSDVVLRESAHIPPESTTGFRIVESDARGTRRALVSPDTATCADCLAEIADPHDRRFAYPFTNCTNCGPRLTIILDVPYDRPTTTMADFEMCRRCRAEYDDPADRRFHAQPVCCPQCGPSLRFTSGDRESGRDAPVPGPASHAPVDRAVQALDAGLVVAVKGLGGYHLAVDAGDQGAVTRLRERKHREEKPFAVMVADIEAAERVGIVGEPERGLLTSPERPITLLRRRPGAPVAPGVAPGNRWVGVMLPYTPLHHLLLRRFGRPLVLTSGNRSDEPIAFRDADVHERLGGIADAYLTHDRPIHTRVDDSVVRVMRGRPVVLRRSRGYVPRPLEVERAVATPVASPVLACGGELKNTFCLLRGRHAFVSHHVGDLENYETYDALVTGIAHFERLFDVAPAVVAHDLHPEYLSTKYALERFERDERVELVGVQHHHAHVAACLADNRATGPVIGLAFDGLGYGTDGTIWGGEILLADVAGFERIGQLEAVTMPGGTAAIRQPWRMAASWVDRAFGSSPPDRLAVRDRRDADWEHVVRLARAGPTSPVTSSMGRLFDAVAALCGVRDVVSYEGQAAVELEQRADPRADGAYDCEVETVAGAGPSEASEMQVIRATEMVRAVVDDLARGVAVATVATRFHRGVARAAARACQLAREATGVTTVALSGGVFQNGLLVDALVPELEARGFEVLLHSRVPPNDGGLSLGQAVVAAARARGAVGPVAEGARS